MTMPVAISSSSISWSVLYQFFERHEGHLAGLVPRREFHLCPQRRHMFCVGGFIHLYEPQLGHLLGASLFLSQAYPHLEQMVKLSSRLLLTIT